MDREEKAAWVNANLPQCAALAALCKATFGAVRLTYASENGHTIGKPMQTCAFSITGDDLVPVRKAKP